MASTAEIGSLKEPVEGLRQFGRLVHLRSKVGWAWS